MPSLTLLAAQKLQMTLTAGNALQQQISGIASAANAAVPVITTAQVVLSSAPPDLSDKNMQLAYPRVCIYSSGLKNTQIEKYRSFSGQVATVAEIWASGDLITQVDEWIHFYIEAITNILQTNIGDWGDGLFYPGAYEVQLQPPKAGGLGFVQSAKLTFNLNASVS